VTPDVDCYLQAIALTEQGFAKVVGDSEVAKAIEPVTNSERESNLLVKRFVPVYGVRNHCATPSSGRAIMSQQFLLFVIAVLLFAIFWELCKINGQLKKNLLNSPRISGGGQTNDAVAAKALG
jgi:hypothetical protein